MKSLKLELLRFLLLGSFKNLGFLSQFFSRGSERLLTLCVCWRRFTTQSLNYVGDACIEFHYEAYGETVNTLAVYTQSGVRDWRAARVELWSVRGNQGNVWIRQRIAFRLTDRTLRVRSTMPLFLFIVLHEAECLRSIAENFVT